MKNHRRPANVAATLGALAVFAFTAALVAPTPAGAQAERVADLNTGRGPTTDSHPREFALLDGISYFAACEHRHGCELWRSDGTTAGTRRVADVCPGPCDSRPSQLFGHAGILYFSADDGQHGREPWRHDPQAGTTTLIVDARPGSRSSDPANFRATTGGAPAGSVLFRARDTDVVASNWGDALWLVQPDGGAAELPLGLERIGAVAPVGPRVFLSAEDPKAGEGQELWVANLTASPPAVQRVRDIAPGSAESGINLMRALPTRNGVVFRADDGLAGAEPWFSDGTGAGTVRIADINPGPSSSFVREILPTAGGSVFFLADDGAGGQSRRDLWLAFGSPFTTIQVRDFPNSLASNLAIAGNSLFFLADEGTGRGREFWVSGGLPQTTFPVASSFPQDFLQSIAHAVVGDHYYVASGANLYRTAGDAGSTRRVGPLNEETAFIRALHGRDDGVLFAIDKLDGVGEELFGSRLSEPTFAGIVRDIHDATGNSDPRLFMALANAPVFAAFDEKNFELLRRIDADGDVALLLPPGERLLLNRFTTVVTRSGPATLFAKDFQERIWRSDGSAAGTALALDPSQPPFDIDNANVRCIDALSPQDLLLLIEENGVPALWRSDGTAAGSERLLGPDDLPPGTQLEDRPCPVRLGEQTLFAARRDDIGIELFRNNGTPGHSALVRDIAPGAIDALDGTTFRVAAGRLFFTANSDGDDYDGDIELWVSDGTGQGTFRLRDIHPTGSSLPHSIIAHGADVAFAARSDEAGHQLWISDGTLAGTRALTNATPQAEHFDLPFDETFGPAIASDGARLFFVATLIGDGGGSHLFTSDGEVDGHRRIRPVDAAAAIAPQQLSVVAGAGVVFAGYSDAHGRELWFSDGSDAGTFLAADVEPGAAGGGPLNLAVLSDGVYFSADDGVVGREPWRLPLPRPETIFANSFE